LNAAASPPRGLRVENAPDVLILDLRMPKKDGLLPKVICSPADNKGVTVAQTAIAWTVQQRGCSL
jgi:hypothetical protein